MKYINFYLVLCIFMNISFMQGLLQAQEVVQINQETRAWAREYAPEIAAELFKQIKGRNVMVQWSEVEDILPRVASEYTDFEIASFLSDERFFILGAVQAELDQLYSKVVVKRDIPMTAEEEKVVRDWFLRYHGKIVKALLRSKKYELGVSGLFVPSVTFETIKNIARRKEIFLPMNLNDTQKQYIVERIQIEYDMAGGLDVSDLRGDDSVRKSISEYEKLKNDVMSVAAKLRESGQVENPQAQGLIMLAPFLAVSLTDYDKKIIKNIINERGINDPLPVALLALDKLKSAKTLDEKLETLFLGDMPDILNMTYQLTDAEKLMVVENLKWLWHEVINLADQKLSDMLDLLEVVQKAQRFAEEEKIARLPDMLDLLEVVKEAQILAEEDIK